MDNNTLNSLKAAYAASPENMHVLVVLLQAMWEQGEVRQAFELLRDKRPEQWPAGANRRVAIEICQEVGEHYKALALIGESGEPEMLLFKARSLAGLDLKEQARQAYTMAIQANAALEDRGLAEALGLTRQAAPEPPPTRPIFAAEKEPGGGEENRRAAWIDDDKAFSPAPQEWVTVEGIETTFADVGGLEHVKKEIQRRIIMPFIKPSLFERFRKRIGGGILLYGPPGCGKTLLARATAGECHARFFNVAIADILSRWFGDSEERLHALFETARRETPSVIFFDEIEALGGKRQYHQNTPGATLVSQFLAEMDGFAQSNKGVLVLAATNVPWAVDPAFRRPGRFDRVLFVPPPDRPAREAILKLLLRDRPGGQEVDAAKVAAKTASFSGADLSQLVETAADLAIDASLEAEREVPLSTALMLEALAEVKPTTLEWLTTARNYARYANDAGQYSEVNDFLNRHGKD